MGSSSPDYATPAKISADASLKAAQIQADTQKQQMAQQQSMFNSQLDYLNKQDAYNKGLTQQNQANYQPYITQGQQGLSQLSNYINNPNSGFNQQLSADQVMQNDPGYQFRQQQGQQALNNNVMATSGMLSGAALKAATNYNQGYASNEYQNAYNRDITNKQLNLGAYGQLANFGLQGAAGYAAGSPQSVTGTQLANVAANNAAETNSILQNGANTQSNLLMSNASNQAQLYMGQNQAAMQRQQAGISGAATGAAIGTSIFPGVGTAVGAGVGYLASLL